MDDKPIWHIFICGCGYPLGGVMAAIALRICPDCKRPTIPVHDKTRSVTVQQVNR